MPKTLYAQGAFGRKANLKDWKEGKDFAVFPEGRPYFSIRDVEKLEGDGYDVIKFIIPGQLMGFKVELAPDERLAEWRRDDKEMDNDN